MSDAYNGRQTEQLREQILLGLRDPLKKMEPTKPVEPHWNDKNALSGTDLNNQSGDSSFHHDDQGQLTNECGGAKGVLYPSLSLFHKIISQLASGSVKKFAAVLYVLPQQIQRAFLSCLLMEYERGTLFLLFAVSSAAGSALYFTLNSEPDWLGLLLATLLLFSIYLLLRKTIVRRSCIALCLGALLGMVGAKYEVTRFNTKMLGGEISTVLTGRVVSLEQQARGGWRIIVDVIETDKPKLRHAPDRLRLMGRDLPAQVEIGSILQGPVRLRNHGGPVRPGHYDFAFHGYFKNIGGNGFYLGIPKYLATDIEPAKLRSGVIKDIAMFIGHLRAVITGRIIQALPGENGAVAAALISGQRAGISEQTNEALRVAGLAHILSISGLHLALAAGVVMVGIRSCAAIFPSIVLYYPVKKYAAVASLLSSAFYLAVSGADVAAQRSFIMISVMLCAVLFDRLALTMRNLAIAAMISVALTPHEILGPSFQMSYSATAALIAVFAWRKAYKSGRYNKREERAYKGQNNWVSRWILQPLSAIAVTSVVAGIASGIYAAYHFHNVAPLGLLGNGLALPVVSVVVMPSAVLSLLAMPFGLEWLPLQLMGLGISLVKWAAKFIANLTPDFIPAIIPDITLLLWTIGLVNIIVFSSWLRWLSFAWFLCGLIFYQQNIMPDIVIAEDARLVAIVDSDILYSNRSRPSQFIISSWLKAYGAKQVVGPQKRLMTTEDKGFICEDKLCIATLSNGRILAHAAGEEAGEAACNIGDIAVLAFSGEKATCGGKDNRPQLVVTRQDLALKGAVALYFQADSVKNSQLVTDEGKEEENIINIALEATPDEYFEVKQNDYFENDIHYHMADDEQLATPLLPYEPDNTEKQEPIAKADYAIGVPERPWHLYRLYSRAARNKPDWHKSNKQSY